MRSPRAALPAAKFLVLLAFCAIFQSSPSEAARRCPSGQILRVSRGTCVPKAENLGLMAKHGSRKGRAAESQDDAPQDSVRKPTADAAASPALTEEVPAEKVARDEPPSPGVQDTPPPSPKPESPRLSPFGALFVGAFRSTVTTGRSAFP